MYQILHIAPHLGGGVGRVLLNMLEKSKDYEQIIYCLDSINDKAKNYLKIHDIKFDENLHKDLKKLLQVIKNVDIVLIHWWNHPFLYDFIVRYTLPACRLIFWSHISGKEVPQIFTKALLKYPDYFVFSTPMSYLTDEISENMQYCNKFKVIWSTAGLEYVQKVKKSEHKQFIIGYIGTLDFAKIHNHFIELCLRISIPNVKFLIVGDGCDKKLLEKKVKELGVETKFQFVGYVDNIVPYLEQMDLFGYPLKKNHYGTCDQVIAEAMGSGLVPIVFNNDMENYMIHHMYTGLVARDKYEYVDYINMMYKNKRLLEVLSNNTKKEAFSRFSLTKMIKEWDLIFNEALIIPKTSKKWIGKYSGIDISPFNVFLESIGKYSEIFEKNDKKEIEIFLTKNKGMVSKTKGSIYHYKMLLNNLNNFKEVEI